MNDLERHAAFKERLSRLFDRCVINGTIPSTSVERLNNVVESLSFEELVALMSSCATVSLSVVFHVRKDPDHGWFS